MMFNFSGDTLAACVPFIFIAIGFFAAACQFFVGHDDSPSVTVEVDPDIRVRVTGKIS